MRCKALFTGYRLAWIGSLLMTLLIVWLVFKRLDGQILYQGLLRFKLHHLPVLVALWLGGTWLRSWQLQMLLPQRIRLSILFLVMLIRNFTVDLLPGRVLSLAAHTVLLKRHGVDSATAGASFAVSTILNALSMVVLVGPALLVVRGQFSVSAFILALLLLAVCGIAFLRWGGALGPLLQRLPWSSWRSWGERWANYFGKIGHLRSLIWPFILGILGRLCKYLLLYNLFLIFSGLSYSLPGLPVFFLALAGAELSAILPLSGLAGFGSWELVFVFMSKTLYIPTASPLEIGLLIHGLTQLWEACWALMAFGIWRWANPTNTK